MFGIHPRYENEAWWSYLWHHVLWCLGRRQLTFWWQRRTRGFDDSDLWSLDQTILRFTLPRLKALQQRVHGFPGEILHEANLGQGPLSETIQVWGAVSLEDQARLSEVAFQRWKEAIGKMILAIELWLDHDGRFENEEQEANFQEGWDLFQKYFFALWD